MVRQTHSSNCFGIKDSEADLNYICLGADEGDAAILAVHQHLPPEVLSQQILQSKDFQSKDNTASLKACQMLQKQKQSTAQWSQHYKSESREYEMCLAGQQDSNPDMATHVQNEDPKLQVHLIHLSQHEEACLGVLCLDIDAEMALRTRQIPWLFYCPQPW